MATAPIPGAPGYYFDKDTGDVFRQHIKVLVPVAKRRGGAKVCLTICGRRGREFAVSTIRRAVENNIDVVLYLEQKADAAKKKRSERDRVNPSVHVPSIDWSQVKFYAGCDRISPYSPQVCPLR